MTLPVIPSNQSPYERGTYSKVARRLGVAPQTVADVAQGRKKSARIAAELQKEARRYARKQAREQAKGAA